jgi:hypothetical protein
MGGEPVGLDLDAVRRALGVLRPRCVDGPPYVLLETAHTLVDELERERAANAKLREALKPFAECAEMLWTQDDPDLGTDAFPCMQCVGCKAERVLRDTAPR